MQLNSKFIKWICCICMLILFSGCTKNADGLQSSIIDESNLSQSPVDTILCDWQDGRENSILIDYYKGYIQDVERISIAGYDIRYLEADFNRDGSQDYFVSFDSALHSGSGGNTCEVLISKETGYERVSFPSIRIAGYINPVETPHSYVIPTITVMHDQTNGLADLIFSLYDDVFYAMYDGKYQYNIDRITPGKQHYYPLETDPWTYKAAVDIVANTYYDGNNELLVAHQVNTMMFFVYYLSDFEEDQLYVVYANNITCQYRFNQPKIPAEMMENHSTFQESEKADTAVAVILDYWTNDNVQEIGNSNGISLPITEKNMRYDFNSDGKADYFLNGFMLLSNEDEFNVVEIPEIGTDWLSVDMPSVTLTVMTTVSNGFSDLVYVSPLNKYYLRYDGKKYIPYPLVLEYWRELSQ